MSVSGAVVILINKIGQIFGFNDLLKSVKKFNEKKNLPTLVALILDETGNRQPQTIWEFLISYTRNQNYPNDIRGAFLDTMSVINNYNKRTRVLTTLSSIFSQRTAQYSVITALVFLTVTVICKKRTYCRQ